MQAFGSDSFQHGCFFEYRGFQKLELSLDPKSSLLNAKSSSNDFYHDNSEISKEKKPIKRLSFKDFCEKTNSPYLLEMIQETQKVMVFNHQALGLATCSKLEWTLEYKVSAANFFEYNFGENIGENIFMARLSACSYQMALVYQSKICIVKPANFWTELLGNKLTIETIFPHSEEEGRYVYLEWSPLNKDYIDRPYFLTLDYKGALRIHYVKETKEEIVREEEKFHCATFSLDGKFIYAINNHQELCKIDFGGSKIVMRRKIEGLSNPEEVMSSQIQQLTPWIFAIGSVLKMSEGDGEPSFKPFLHVISGDISDLNEELKIKMFEMPLLSNENVVFRSLFVKERQLLLFGHTKSNKILALYFGLDGSIQEIDGLNLGNNTLRGLVLVKQDSSEYCFGKGSSRFPVVSYKDQKFKLPLPPQILVLDSNSDLHHFYYFDTRFSAPALAMTIRSVLTKKFIDREKSLWKKLIPPKKSRCKSLEEKTLGLLQSTKSKRDLSLGQEKRDKYSLWPDENPQKNLETTANEKQTKIREFRAITAMPPSRFTNLFKATEKPSLFTSQKIKFEVKETENTKPKKISSPFQTQDKPLFTPQVRKTEIKETDSKPTNNLFSSAKTSGSSLFGPTSKSKPSFAFEKKTSQKDETHHSLFSQVQPKAFDASNLFSSNAQPKTFLKVFETPEDPTKKKAFLFLNKFESDVLFKVENEEFPAHKYILSEKCKFFKNMFESGMLESHSSVIQVPEIKASVFKAFLEYVYKGQTLLTEELALNLIDLSERYIIHEMKLACENFLQNVLSLDNCFKIFETAYLYDAALLKKWTLFFFQININKIMERKDLGDIPKISYIQIYKTKWNEKVILGPPLSELMIVETEPEMEERQED